MVFLGWTGLASEGYTAALLRSARTGGQPSRRGDPPCHSAPIAGAPSARTWTKPCRSRATTASPGSRPSEIAIRLRCPAGSMTPSRSSRTSSQLAPIGFVRPSRLCAFSHPGTRSPTCRRPASHPGCTNSCHGARAGDRRAASRRPCPRRTGAADVRRRTAHARRRSARARSLRPGVRGHGRGRVGGVDAGDMGCSDASRAAAGGRVGRCQVRRVGRWVGGSRRHRRSPDLELESAAVSSVRGVPLACGRCAGRDAGTRRPGPLGGEGAGGRGQRAHPVQRARPSLHPRRPGHSRRARALPSARTSPC